MAHRRMRRYDMKNIGTILIKFSGKFKGVDFSKSGSKNLHLASTGLQGWDKGWDKGWDIETTHEAFGLTVP